MHSFVCMVAAYALNASWEIPLAACGGWVASRLLRRCGPRAEHSIWVMAFLLGIGTPILPALASLFAGLPSAGGGHVSIVLRSGGAVPVTQAGTILLPVWLLWLVGTGYLASLAFGAGRFVWLLAKTRSLVVKSQPTLLPSEMEVLWQRARGAFCLIDAQLRSSERVRGIAAAGRRRPVVLVAPGFVERCSEEEFLSAMGHELAHLERRDPAFHLVIEAAGLLVGFHPVSWIVKTRMARTREMVCDAMAVERLVEAKAYRQSLLRLAQRMVVAPATGAGGAGNVRRKCTGGANYENTGGEESCERDGASLSGWACGGAAVVDGGERSVCQRSCD